LINKIKATLIKNFGRFIHESFNNDYINRDAIAADVLGCDADRLVMLDRNSNEPWSDLYRSVKRQVNLNREGKLIYKLNAPIKESASLFEDVSTRDFREFGYRSTMPVIRVLSEGELFIYIIAPEGLELY